MLTGPPASAPLGITSWLCPTACDHAGARSPRRCEAEVVRHQGLGRLLVLRLEIAEVQVPRRPAIEVDGALDAAGDEGEGEILERDAAGAHHFACARYAQRQDGARRARPWT